MEDKGGMMLTGGEVGWRLKVADVEAVGAGVALVTVPPIVSSERIRRRQTLACMGEDVRAKLDEVLQGMRAPQERAQGMWGGNLHKQLVQQLGKDIAATLKRNDPAVVSAIQDILYRSTEGTYQKLTLFLSDLQLLNESAREACERAVRIVDHIDSLKASRDSDPSLELEKQDWLTPVFARTYEKFGKQYERCSESLAISNRTITRGWGTIAVGGLLLADSLIVLFFDDHRGLERFFTN